MMQPEMFSCCENQQPSWIFIYENNIVFSICEKHFHSKAHRCFVKDIINYENGQRYSPVEIFREHSPPLVRIL